MKKNLIIFIAVFLYSISIIGMGYLIPRSDAVSQISLYFLCFGAYIFLYQFLQKGQLSFSLGIALALLLRLFLFESTPVLSDDFYRFIWDGQLVWNGINPYLYQPNTLIDSSLMIQNSFFEVLLDKMNSSGYYSVYLPLNQLFFALAAGFGGQNLDLNILWLRIFLFFFELVNFFLFYQILKILGKSPAKLFLYALNPLVVMEIVGNLHFESSVLTGILGAILMYLHRQPIISASFWAWAVGMKLTPLMICPLLVKIWDKDKRPIFLISAVVFIFVLFIPLTMDKGFIGFFESLRLYQGTFEFNGSIYLLLRNVASLFLGYNPIAILTPLLNLISFFLIIWIAYKSTVNPNSKFIEALVLTYLVYLLLQPVVHPWYLIPAVGLSILTNKKSFLAWSGLVFLSYTAYSTVKYEENIWMILLEYISLTLFIYTDYFSSNTINKNRSSI